jgi:hypothetical protein
MFFRSEVAKPVFVLEVIPRLFEPFFENIR